MRIDDDREIDGPRQLLEEHGYRWDATTCEHRGREECSMTFPDVIQGAVRRDFPEPVWREALHTLPSPGTFGSEVPVDRVRLR